MTYSQTPCSSSARHPLFAAEECPLGSVVHRVASMDRQTSPSPLDTADMDVDLMILCTYMSWEFVSMVVVTEAVECEGLDVQS